MLGLDDYGSGSESESETKKQKVSNSPTASTNLPQPSLNDSPKIPLHPPRTIKRAPKKILIDLPTLSKKNEEREDDTELERPPVKRPRVGAGSSLLSMLPAPKQTSAIPPAPERILGGGNRPGLIFNENKNAVSTGITFDREDEEREHGEDVGYIPTRQQGSGERENPTMSSSLPFLPPSLVRGKPNISLEERPEVPAKLALPSVSTTPSAGFFSLDSSKSSNSPNRTPKSSFSLPTLSSAPALPTFKPPEPTPQDPYPGYYQLPSGSWAAYDTEYYAKFRKKWQDNYNAYVRGLEKGTLKGFEGYEDAASEVDAMKEMEKAKIEVKEREERKSLSKGATGQAEQPKMKFNASKLSGIARSRHQLSTLLRDAYENREALEEKIAEGRRNRKEAGNKYGF